MLALVLGQPLLQIKWHYVVPCMYPRIPPYQNAYHGCSEQAEEVLALQQL